MGDKKEQLRVKDLGKRSGKMLIFGGVYSNLQALEALQKKAVLLDISPENIICTGDVVGYCAEPEACVQAIRNWGVAVIAGNVEMQLAEGEADCGCNFGEGSRCDMFSRKWYPFAQSKLSASSIQWMQNLPDHIRFSYAGKSAYVLHGSFFNASAFIFRSTPWAVKQANFDAVGAQLILSGHCGLPFQHVIQGYSWLNAGVIGMPANDGTPRVWYLILEEEEGKISFQHQALDYDHERAASLMEAEQLPCEYSNTLRSGLWDNCEILPEEETLAQGKHLLF